MKTKAEEIADQVWFRERAYTFYDSYVRAAQLGLDAGYQSGLLAGLEEAAKILDADGTLYAAAIAVEIRAKAQQQREAMAPKGRREGKG